MWELLIQANVSSGTFSRGFKLLTITSLKFTACTSFQSKVAKNQRIPESLWRPKFVEGKAVSEDVSKSSICWRIADNWRLYSRLLFFGWHVVKHFVQLNFQPKNWKYLASDKIYLSKLAFKECFAVVDHCLLFAAGWLWVKVYWGGGGSSCFWSPQTWTVALR